MQLQIKKITSLFLLFLLIGSNLTQSRAQVRPIYDSGAGGLAQALKRLPTTASAMHTGAHPDDEDSGLLAYLARKEMARTVYLSLNRGEGGQNVIGTELFEPLGVIRAEELLQARRLDGGQQLFTSVMDYGFSKTRAEAARIWGEEHTLADMVRAIRMFRPLVVIARFTGTPADGHGQHQLSGYLTPLAFKAAADPNQFPEQIREGLRPWQAKKLYVSQSFVQNAQNVPTLVMNTGEFDPLLGRSYFEIAMEGRSQHKTQEMGTLELRGKMTSGVRLLESAIEKREKEASVFDGIDTSIKGIAALTNNSEEPFAKKLDDLQETANRALKEYDVYAPEKLIPILAKGYKQASEAEMSTRNPESKEMLRRKQEEFAQALQLAAGVVVDALSDAETIVAGDQANVAVRVFAPENTSVKVKQVELMVPQNWTASPAPEPIQQESVFRPRRENAFNASFFTVTASADAGATQPYWLEKPRSKNFTFDWSAEDAAKNMPFQPALLKAQVKIDVDGVEIPVSKDVQYRFADDIRGEIRRDVQVVPLVSVAPDSNLLISPVAAKPSRHKLVVSVTNNAPRETNGALKLNVPAGWTVTPATSDFTLKSRGEKTAVSFDVTIPANARANDYQITPVAVVNGKTYDRMMQEIAYPHIQTHRRYLPSDVSAKVVDLKIAPVRVGYIMGSGDRVPEAIQRLGLNVAMLEEKDLSTGDLSKFDTIVVGIRASQVRPDFVANNGRLLDFVRNGGTLIVQYQQQEYIQKNLAPYPAKMEAVINGTQRISNVRVTDENAPVKILAPAHPVFNYPNKIGASDWENWIQERNLYSFSTFDEKYTPLLEAHDEGEPEANGGMVYAEVGKGKYIYTSYSWFRQLPVGNVGAYRIFANMLSLPKASARK
ncbi:MAG TPA: PIG-L family deacetylase [Pyrinomonadaceae bacterium]|jgi:LmbE family N-acetylglucosaminyl deacetylase